MRRATISIAALVFAVLGVVVVSRAAAQSGEASTGLESDDPSTRYEACVHLDDDGAWRRAVDCYLSYVEDFPDGDRSPRAMIDAAELYESHRRVAKAIQLRIQLLKEYPDSELAGDNLFRIAVNYHRIANYTEAAKFYEKYAKWFDDDRKRARRALRLAAAMRRGLEQRDRAIEDYKRVFELVGEDESTRVERAEILYDVAELFRERGEREAALKHYRKARKIGGASTGPGLKLRALVRIGEVYRRRDESDRARDTFRKVRSRYEALGEDVRGRPGTKRAVARAHFRVVQLRAERFDIEKAGTEGRDSAELFDRLSEVKGAFEDVVKYRRIRWAVAALSEIGQLYDRVAEQVDRKLEGASADDIAKKVGNRRVSTVSDVLDHLEDGAAKAYRHVVAVARKSRWYGERVDHALGRLRELRPEKFPPNSEIHATGGAMRDGFVRAPFLERLEGR